jgi:hypothetical protein
LVQPNWGRPAPEDTLAAAVAAARHASGLLPVVPAGLGRPAAIYATRGSQKELDAVPAMNGRPDVTGTAKSIRVGARARALQTVSPCVSGSTTDWHTSDGQLQVEIDGHTPSERAGARAARLTERSVTPA